MWLVGGGELVRDFLQQRLVNQIALAIHPRLLGQRVPRFPPPYPETELELVQCKQYANGLMQVFYSVKKQV